MKKFFLNIILFLYAGIAFAAVDLNTASKAELEKINGIGPAKAQAIITYRTQQGGFKNVEELQKIKGIGKGKTFEKIKGQLVVGNPSTTPSTSPKAAPANAAEPTSNRMMMQPVQPVAPAKK